MPAKKRKKPRASNRQPHSLVFRLLMGGLFLIFSGMLFAAMLDFRPEQLPRFESDVTDRNMIGIAGAYMAYWLFTAFGAAAWLIPTLLLWLSVVYNFGHGQKLNTVKWSCAVLLVISVCVLATIVEIEVQQLEETSEYVSNARPHGAGGFIGSLAYRDLLRDFVGAVGTSVVFGAATLAALLLMTWDNVLMALRGLFGRWREARAARKEALKQEREEAAARAEEAAKAAAVVETPQPDAPPPKKKRKGPVDAPPPGKGSKPGSILPAAGSSAPPGPEAGKSVPLMDEPEPAIDMAEPPIDDIVPSSPAPGAAAAEGRASMRAQRAEKGLKIIAGEQVQKASKPLPEKRGDYIFPPPSLLKETTDDGSEPDDANHQETAETLVRTLKEFKVNVTPGEVHIGPVITRYDVYPDAGVRVEKIATLDKNIALNLKALSVRVLAPVPGKGCVGIEVPNKKPQSVFIRDILDSDDWVNSKAEIPVALGKEVSGKPLIADLTKMPHLLIAGSTGSGKTVCINAVICSLLYHSSPDDIRFVMVDPKIVEMQVFNALPHMLIPVVTDPKKVPGALKYLLQEMENRYQIFAKEGVRNIAGFNAKRAKDKASQEQAKEADSAMSPEERAALSSVEVPRDLDVEIPDKLPYIVCIIDELADLMMVAPADIETGVARLAQLARAAGIHLIIATQRPSVNVITGVIKANLPSRIAFKVASKVDSRTILDAIGADHLIGRGDMLFLPPGSSDLVRAQGCFVADEEISEIVEYLKRNGEPQFDEQFQRSVEQGDAEGDDDEDTLNDDEDAELIKQAIKVIKTSKRASTSNLQRKLRIGYNRAARVMDKLEDMGVVGPEQGSSPRDILIDPDSM